MTGPDPRAARSIRRRLALCGALFLLPPAAILARAVQLQVQQGDRLAGMARDQYLRELELTPRRGLVTDAHGAPLAASAEADSVFVDPSAAKDLPVERLAKALHLDAGFVRRRASGKGSFAWLKRRVSPGEAEAVRGLRLEGVGNVKEFRRFYPQRELASHVVGFVGIDNDGLEGAERAWDHALRGSLLEVRAIRDARGAQLLQEPGVPSAALSGATVELSIDSAIQHAAEQALARGVAKANARAGMIVVMDPHTGAVLALANHPTYNPNAPGSDLDSRRNRAVNDTYEPGSTVKVFTMAGALADGAVRPDTRVEVGDGKLPIGRRTIRDSHRPPAPELTATEVLSLSSNVGAARIGLRLGPARLSAWLRAFGFAERTGVGLPGEPRGQLQDPERMKDIGTATTAFGQGMSATPLQVTTALCAVANGGRLLRPYVVQRVVQADGTPLLERKPEVVREVIAPATARTLAGMMVAVTRKGGTGTLAALPGFDVAGKTGTAQKPDPLTRGYSADRRFSSFMGFAPAQRPRVAVFVGLDEPKGDVYGGLVAAPVFREVAAEALRQLGVEPDGVGVGALDVAIAQKRLERAASDAARPSDPLVAEDELGDEGELPPAGDGAIVPDLTGLSMRAAMRLLHERGLEADPSGTGRALSQEPKAGRTVARGTKVRVVLNEGWRSG